MNTGLQMDGCIAEHVLKLEFRDESYVDGRGTTITRHSWYEGNKLKFTNLPPYSNEVSVAWEVLNRFKRYQVTKLKTGRFECHIFFSNTNVEATFEADTVPHAICGACLAAVGYPV